MERIHKSAVVAGAAAANVVNDATGKTWFIGSGTNAYLPQIQYGEGIASSISHIHAEAERRQISFIGADTETVVASTRYKVILGNIYTKYESQFEGTRWYAYKSPATLTGTANTDRLNMYTELVSKINAFVGKTVTAYLCYKVTFGSGQDVGGKLTAGFATTPTNNRITYGTIGTQGATGCTCKVAFYEHTGGTWAGNDEAGYLWLYDISDVAAFTAGIANTIQFDDTTSYVASGTPTTLDESLIVTGSAIVAGQGMAIVDDAGYHNILTGRVGKSAVFTDGFSTAHSEVTRESFYETGIGTNMLAQIPVFDASGQSLIKGQMDYDFVQGQAPVAGTYYTKVEFDIKRKVNTSLMSPNTNNDFTHHYVCWAAQAAISNITDVHNFVGAIVTALAY